MSNPTNPYTDREPPFTDYTGNSATDQPGVSPSHIPVNPSGSPLVNPDLNPTWKADKASPNKAPFVPVFTGEKVPLSVTQPDASHIRQQVVDEQKRIADAKELARVRAEADKQFADQQKVDAENRVTAKAVSDAQKLYDKKVKVITNKEWDDLVALVNHKAR